ncbi:MULTISPECIES: MarR family transcriptional regulator [Atopobiaceae]|uniref:MarR family transcriptional regulator n=1 Tax=Atopobiaceae TaxID=1643824 RepID=UPI00094ACA21|nr:MULTISPECIES: MarR family transcriptional regulator [Atopobiaceae]MBM6814248.1 MarR family transcriptional regulator [Olsenella uli]NJE80684.1 MarR family transcriptional regulator [Olsenella sp. SW781]
MDDYEPSFAPSYAELAQELLQELGQLGRAVGPKALNATRGETAVLMTLFRSEEPLTPGSLGSFAQVSSARTANILRSLEEKGLVTRTHSSEDRRCVRVALTDEGRRRADSIRQERTQAVARYLESLGPSDAAELVRIVRRSRDILVEAVTGEVAE